MNISFYLIPKSEVTYIHQEDTVAQALRVIHKHGYQAVPVIDEKGRYVGTISEEISSGISLKSIIWIWK